jgi:hypothetical protein
MSGLAGFWIFVGLFLLGMFIESGLSAIAKALRDRAQR